MSALRRTVLIFLSAALLFVCLTGCVASETEESDPDFSATISGTAPVLPGTPSPPENKQ